MQPCLITLPVPVNVVPPQQNLYCPVCEFHRRTVVGFESSCKITSNVLIEKEQVAVLPDMSVAVHVTVVVPTLTQVPDGGTHTTVTIGQLSDAVGSGKFTTAQVTPGAGQTV